MNEMEQLAQAAFYINDVLEGRVGTFTIDEDGWGRGDTERCIIELRGILATLDAEWTRDDKMARNAPYTGNIKRAVFKKTFDKPIGKRWVVMTFSDRFGIHVEVTSYAERPWF